MSHVPQAGFSSAIAHVLLLSRWLDTEPFAAPFADHLLQRVTLSYPQFYVVYTPLGSWLTLTIPVSRELHKNFSNNTTLWGIITIAKLFVSFQLQLFILYLLWTTLVVPRIILVGF